MSDGRSSLNIGPRAFRKSLHLIHQRVHKAKIGLEWEFYLI